MSFFSPRAVYLIYLSVTQIPPFPLPPLAMNCCTISRCFSRERN